MTAPGPGPPRHPLALIVAVARDGAIGRAGDLPWRLREDLRHFRRTTTGHAVVMGRRTWESIGRPLKNRRNIVVSRDPALRIDGCEVAASLDEALALARQTDDEPFVIGGASLYEAALPHATRLVLTEVPVVVDDADTFFPEWDRAAWEETERREGEEATYVTLVRRSAPGGATRSAGRPGPGGARRR